MKHLTRRSFHISWLVVALSVLALVGCDNQLNFSPTVPTFTQINTVVGAVRTLQISGELESESGACLKAMILFDGQEVQGSRSRCEEAEGCANLELSAVIGAFAGQHTITFKVLRQTVETENYRGSGTVAISIADLHFEEPVTVELRPQRDALQAGEGLTFELELLD